MRPVLRILLAACLCVAAQAARRLDRVDTSPKAHPCDKADCPQGRCHYTDCRNPTSCEGGLCKFTRCQAPTCDGGHCTFEESHNPTCRGGLCTFLDTITVLGDGFCTGGKCVVDGEETASNMEDDLAM